jgi:hypothetical protein
VSRPRDAELMRRIAAVFEDIQDFLKADGIDYLEVERRVLLDLYDYVEELKAPDATAEQEAAVIEIVQNMRDAGMTMGTITQTLKNLGVRLPSGSKAMSPGRHRAATERHGLKVCCNTPGAMR